MSRWLPLFFMLFLTHNVTAHAEGLLERSMRALAPGSEFFLATRLELETPRIPDFFQDGINYGTTSVGLETSQPYCRLTFLDTPEPAKGEFRRFTLKRLGVNQATVSENKTDFVTVMELEDADGPAVELVCHKLFSEITLGEFEMVMGSHARFGQVVLGDLRD